MTHVLGKDFDSIRTKILARYIKFFGSLLKSKSPEVVLMAKLVQNDKSSVTGRNLEKIVQETGIKTLDASS